MTELQAFHVPTTLCNADDPEIQRVAASLTQARRSDVEKSVALFRFVRDEVRYRLGLFRDSAAETLRQRAGSCSNKANLLVALLRASGIPGGFHLLTVKTKEYFGPLCTPQFHRHLSDRSLHVYCSVFLEGRWLKCDPSDDKVLSEATVHINPQSRMIDFDGTRDALLNLDPRHILFEDPNRLPDIDAVLSKACRKPPVFLEVLDRYLDFMREHGRRYDDPDALGRDFLTQLETTFPTGYALVMGNGQAA